MDSLAAGWDSLPATVRWPVGLLATAALYGVAYVVAAAALGLDPGDDDLAIRLALLVVAIPLFVAGAALQRHRLGGKGQLGLYRQAYRTGTIPAGANIDKWRPVVRKQARFFREGGHVQRWAAIVLVGMMLLLAVGGLVASAGDIDATLVVVVAGSIVFAVLLFWGADRLWRWRRRQFARLDRALAEIDAAPDA